MRYYVRDDIREALNEYRDEVRSVMFENAADTPAGSDIVAAASEDYVFVWGVAVEDDGDTVAGRMAEYFFMSEERFEHTDGGCPDGKEPYQLWIDAVLEAEDEVFTFVAVDEPAADVITDRCDAVGEDGQYTVLASENTEFFYREQLLD